MLLATGEAVMNIVENRFGDIIRQVRAHTGASTLSGGGEIYALIIVGIVGSLPEHP